MARIAIVGSRGYPDEAGVRAFVTALKRKLPQTEIVSGGARGVDSWAADQARIEGLKVTVFLPDYVQHANYAPLLRNTEIAKYADAAEVFWDGESPGTRHVTDKFLDFGKPVHVRVKK